MAPRGHYLAHEVGFLAGISGPLVGQWAKNGYIRSSQGTDLPRIYSFQDVAEAMVVHELTDAGVEYSDIREAIRGLRERFGEDWPLSEAQAKLGTYGAKGKAKRRVAYADDEGVYDLGHKKWQQMDASDLGRISGLLRRGGWAARKLKGLRYIEVNPDRLSGTPTIKDRRVAARSVAELAEQGKAGFDLLRHEYDLGEGQINDAQRWWREASKLAAA
jgi:uncharacterized protein (DUF433 family)